MSEKIRINKKIQGKHIKEFIDGHVEELSQEDTITILRNAYRAIHDVITFLVTGKPAVKGSSLWNAKKPGTIKAEEIENVDPNAIDMFLKGKTNEITLEQLAFIVRGNYRIALDLHTKVEMLFKQGLSKEKEDRIIKLN